MKCQERFPEIFGKILLLSTVACGGQHESPLPSGSRFISKLAGSHAPKAISMTPSDDAPAQTALKTADAAPLRVDQILPIPPRLQWNTGHGYCGETAIQAIGLYYGAWISQQVVRDAGGGEILLGVNSDDALKRLGLDFESWDFDHQQTPQFDHFALWMKERLLQGIPVVFAEFLADEEDNSDYDHIVAATGIKLQSSKADTFNAKDVLVFSNNFRKSNFNLSFERLKATREECRADLDAGGCIPQEVDYGVAIKGILDGMKATMPARLTVDQWDEPNVSQGEAPRQMHARLLVSGLTKGQKYAILRFDDVGKMPTDGAAEQFLAAPFAMRTDFQAQGAAWTFEDPTPFLSNGSLYYRVVPLP